MIKHTEILNLPLAADRLLGYLQRITVKPYRPIACGYTHSHELTSLPDFRLIEGVTVPPHDDGIAGYRPILMLHNPKNSYTIRDCGNARHPGYIPIFITRPGSGIVTSTGSPQRPGVMVILDVDYLHEVRSNDPNGALGSWSGLVWGPGGKPLMKSDWTVDQVAEIAKQKTLRLCNTICERLNAN